MVPDDPSLNVGIGDFSVGFWIRTGSSTGCFKGLIDKRAISGSPAGYSLYLAGGRHGLQLSDSQGWANYTCTSVVVDDGLFHHVVATVDRASTNGLVVSVDGKPVCEFDPTGQILSLDNSAELRIGTSHDTPDPCFFDGILDHLALWSRALAPSEVADSLGGARAWWPLDGNLEDKVGGNNGAAFGGPGFISSPQGGALSLDGIDDAVLVPDDPSLDLDSWNFSISYWIQTTQSAGCWPSVLDKRQFAGGPGYSVFLSAGRPGIQLATDSGWENFVSSMAIADGIYHSVVITVDRDSTTGVKVFIDGHPVSRFDPTTVSGSLDNTSDLLIGSSTGASPCFLQATIDELRIHGRVLSDQEITFLALSEPAVIFLDGWESQSTNSWSVVFP
jgi:hypothetical protein